MPRHNRPANLKTYIAESEGRGRGVFASQGLKKGEVVEVAPIIVIPFEEVEVLSLTVLANYFFAAVSDETDVMAGGHASMYNHNFEPNATWAVGKDFIVVKALKPIHKDEEIFINYGWSKESYDAVGIQTPLGFGEEYP